MAATIAITGGAPAKSDERMGSLTLARPVARIAPPQSGIKLLEDIMQKMHSMSPQIAMAKSKQAMVAYQSQSAQAQTSQAQLADPLLAIKPKEKTKPALGEGDTRTKTLAMAPPQAASARFEYAPGSYAQSRARGAEQSLDEAKSIAQKKDLDDDALKSKLQQEGFGEGVSRRKVAEPSVRDARTADMERASGASHGAVNSGFHYGGGGGGAEFGAADKARGRSNNETQVAGALVPGYANLRQQANTLSPESQHRLGAAAGKLFNLSKQMEEFNQIATNATNATAAPQEKKETGYLPLKRPYRAQQTLIADHPTVTEYNGPISVVGSPQSAPPAGTFQGIAPALQGASNGTIGPQGGDANAPYLKPLQPGLYRTTREFGKDAGAAAGDAFSNASADQVASSRPRQDAVGNKNAKSNLVALLPPNVITGIPLVRLGSSAMEANRAISSMGSVTKQQIGAWTVWSLNRVRTHEVMMQIYMRHGMVEAMRIFDSSLIAPDFGVNLGDDLPAVKKKFGEPAFILCEPTAQGGLSPGQNYVYPISQVGFQLARLNNNPAPQVVSLLIFNVK